MATQIYYEDLEMDGVIASLEKVATTRMLVQWAGATGDFNPLHYDADFARATGTGAPIVHGALKRAWLGQLVTDLAGEQGMVCKLSCQYRGMDYPRKMKTFREPQDGETWLCKGKVARKYIENGRHYVGLEIWVENGQGVKTTPGSALLILPSKNGK